MWLHLPSTCLPSVPESAESSLDSASLSESARASFVLWRGKPLAQPGLLRAWKMASWIRRLSGMTFERSTLDRGADAWISSLPATRASRSAAQVFAEVSQILGTSGPRLRESPESAPLLWSSARTWPTMPRTDSTPSVETWKRWATTLRRSSRAHWMLERPICEAAFSGSAWPTPLATRRSPRRKHKLKAGETLEAAAQTWATPTVGDSRGSRNATANRKAVLPSTVIGETLSDQIQCWPTPDASVSNDSESPESWRARQAQLLTKGINGNGAGVPLAIAAKEWQWPTPMSNDATRGGDSFKRGNLTLPGAARAFGQVPSLPVETMSTAGDGSSRSTRVLNPRFVELLMGLPSGWTSFAPVATESFRRWLRSHSVHWLESTRRDDMSKIRLPIQGEPTRSAVVRRGPAWVVGLGGSPTGSASPVGSTHWKRVRRCPREHALHELVHLRGLGDDEALTVGFLVHHALEAFYRAIMDWQKRLERAGYDTAHPDEYYLFGALQPAQQAAWDAVKAVATEPGYFEPTGDGRIEPTWTVVERVLAHYFERYARRDRWRIVAVEETLVFNGDICYSARLDLMVECFDRHGLWVVEHKTARAITRDVLEGYQLDLQTLGQVWLVNRCIDLTELPPFRGTLVNIVTKGKTPQFERVEVCPSNAHLGSFERSVWAWMQIEKLQGELGYPHAFGACTGPDRGYRRCGFFDLCHAYPLASIEAFQQGAPPDGFVRVDPTADDPILKTFDPEAYSE